jgi:hypothetical protein
MPMKADWPSPARTMLRQISVPRLPLREITPISPGWKMFVLKPGMMPTKPSPGVTSPAVFGPTMRVPLGLAAAWIIITSCAGMCSVRMTSSFTPAAIASSAAARAAPGGMNMTDTSNGAVFIASTAVAKIGTPQCISPAFLGFTPPTMVVPQACIFSVQKVPCLPVMPWTSTRSLRRTIIVPPPPPP